MKNEKLNVLIVEDEFLTVKRIKKSLTSYNYNVSFDASSVEEAKAILLKEAIDLVLVDINLKGKESGIDLGAFIQKNLSIPFIYLTAYESTEIVQQALKTKPSAYLTKPFNNIELYTSIELAATNFYENNTKTLDYLYIKEGAGLIKIIVKDIFFIKTDGNYLKLYTEDDTLICRLTLKKIKEQLPEDFFVQCHKSYVVNLRKIKSYTSVSIKLLEEVIPISRSYKEILTYL